MLYTSYRQYATKRQTAGIKFTYRPKIRFFRPAWATRCTDSGPIWHGRRAPGSAWVCNILPQSAQGVGMRPPKYEKFPLFVKSRLAGANPLTDL